MQLDDLDLKGFRKAFVVVTRANRLRFFVSLPRPDKHGNNGSQVKLHIPAFCFGPWSHIALYKLYEAFDCA